MEKTKENLKLELLFSDRIGIVSDIANQVTLNGLNIVSMEVEKIKDKANVCIEIEKDPAAAGLKTILKTLSHLPGVRRIREIRTLPRERKEKRFQIVFDGVREGIISTDENGAVTTINKVAAGILNSSPEEILGRNIDAITPHNNSLRECIEKKISVYRKENIVTPGGRVEYFASAKPIKDSTGRFVGAVVIMNNLREIRQMVEAVSRPAQTTFEDFLGNDKNIQRVITLAQKTAKTDATVSIRGQSGTGKELFASAIHFESGREGPFIPVNCAAMPEALLESELFGYAEGAFTGAKKKGKPGLFEIADGGTLFLDEIGEMPPGPQAKILRVLQEGCVRRIGGTGEIPVNTRIITATNKDLEKMVKENSFREDLYYRINVVPIHLPPLQERIEDLPVLVKHFLLQFNIKLGKAEQVFTEEAMNKLKAHHWPGNVRELKNVIERASILCDGHEIERENILFSHETGRNVTEKMKAPPEAAGGESLRSLTAAYEKEIIRNTLQNARSIRKAATQLEVSHTTLLNKLKKHNIKLERK